MPISRSPRQPFRRRWLRRRLAGRAAFALVLVVLVAALRGGAAQAQLAGYEVFDGRRDRSSPAPIVMVLHGGGGSGPQVRRTTGFDRWAQAAGVVAVYPSAQNRVWNDGRLTGLPHRARLTDHDDVAALLDLADDLDSQGIGDAAMLFVIGHSNGGGMAMLMACTVPDRLAGIGVVATKVLLNAPCPRPDDPVPAVFFFGTADELNPHAGRKDASRTRDAKLGLSLSADESIALWARRNRCGAPVARSIDPADDGASVQRSDWQGCAAPLRYYEVTGGGHAWPGTRPALGLIPRKVPEILVQDIDAGREAMAFFSAIAAGSMPGVP